MRRSLLTVLLLFSCVPASAAYDYRPWEELSDIDVSPQGRAALKSPGEWKHAESEHFIYHYVDPKLVDTVLAHSETYYGWIKEAFGVEKDAWKEKVHVFVFHDEAEWKAFVARVHGGGPHPYAFTSGWELFIYRDPFWLAPQKTLAHELTHVIAFRFLGGPIPLFLNEGLAEFIGWRAAAQKTDGNQYALRAMQWIPEEKYVPVARLAEARDYPEDVETFYRESELFVRFLADQDPALFHRFLKDLSNGAPFPETLRQHYRAELPAVEELFRVYATTGKRIKN